MRFALAIALLTSLAATPPPALAAVPAESADPIVRFNRAVDLALAYREAGKHDEALAALDEALAAIVDRSGPQFDRGRSRVRYYKALTLVALERFEAAEALLALLEQSPGLSDAERGVVTKRLAEVRAALAEQRANRPGRVEIVALDGEGRPVHAQARIDGADVGATPVSVTLPPGEHRIEVSGPELAQQGQDFSVAPGSSGRLVVRVQTVTREIPFDPPPAAIGVAVGGAALLGVAVVLDALGTDDYERSLRADEITLVEARALFHAAERKIYPAYALYGVGGALAAGGLVWLLVDGWPEPEDGRASVTVGASGAGEVHVTIGGRF